MQLRSCVARESSCRCDEGVWKGERGRTVISSRCAGMVSFKGQRPSSAGADSRVLSRPAALSPVRQLIFEYMGLVPTADS